MEVVKDDTEAAREGLATRQAKDPMRPLPVVVTDIKMSFGSMVVFMVKWTIAAIPAFIILAILGAIIVALIPAIAAYLTQPHL
jgi:CHASE2 domain-containing sensor protein